MCDLIVSLSLAVFEAEGKIRAFVKITLENLKKRENVKVRHFYIKLHLKDYFGMEFTTSIRRADARRSADIIYHI